MDGHNNISNSNNSRNVLNNSNNSNSIGNVTRNGNNSNSIGSNSNSSSNIEKTVSNGSNTAPPLPPHRTCPPPPLRQNSIVSYQEKNR